MTPVRLKRDSVASSTPRAMRYSVRNTISGSADPARLAGITAARMVTTSNTTTHR